jgi:dolichol-phosphate mannosyltransferase
MDTKFRHISSWVFNITARILTRTMVTDSLFGFIAIRRNVIEQIDYDQVFWGYGDYCIRMMYYLQKNGASILQIPTMLGTRLSGQSKSSLVRMLLKYSKEVIALALKKRNV